MSPYRSWERTKTRSTPHYGPAGITADELEHMYEERGTPRGTFEEVAALMEAYATLGVSRFYLQRGTDFDRDDEAALIVELAAAGR